MERKLIAAAVSSALVLPMAAQAVEFSVSGHINRAIISVDGGDADGSLQHVDANSSQTRFRFTGSGELDGGMTAGVQLEYGLTGNVRHANVSLASAGGKLTIGHGSRATDGMAHADLGGASWLGGATNWCSYHSTGPACPSNDGGRGPMLRYDTPSIGAASIAVSTADGDYWDAKLSVAGSMGDTGYALRIGHIGEHDGGGDVTTASASVGIGQGTSVTAAWSQHNGNDHEYQYLKLDHVYGDGSIGVVYKRGEDADGEGSLLGIGVGHSLGGGATAYAGYRQMSEDGEDDVDLVVVGMRVTFN
jgi:predicted porin